MSVKTEKRLPVVLQQLRMRVVAVRQAHEELVQVETARQRLPRQGQHGSVRLRCPQGAELRAVQPGHQQRYEGLQQAPKRRGRPPGAPGHQSETARMGAEYLHDEAGLAPRTLMQNETGIQVDAVRSRH